MVHARSRRYSAPDRARALVLAPFSPRYLTRLRRSADVTYESWLDTRRLQDPEALGARLAAEGIAFLIVEADFVFDEVFEAASALRLVGVCRNALNQVDVESATAHGVAVTHTPGRNTIAVAELTLGLMLALARGIPQAHRLVAGGGWGDPAMAYRAFRGREIAGSTVGVVGCGQIGREVVSRCLALGAKVIVHDPLVPDEAVSALGADAVGLELLAARSDFVTLHVPANEATVRLIDATFIAGLKRGAFVVNTSAGSAIDTAALVAALESGRLRGAALDVFEGQPLPLSSPLLGAPNVILTPHIGGATEETVARQSLMMTGEVERFLAAEPLRHIVNPEVQAGHGR